MSRPLVAFPAKGAVLVQRRDVNDGRTHKETCTGSSDSSGADPDPVPQTLVQIVVAPTLGGGGVRSRLGDALKRMRSEIGPNAVHEDALLCGRHGVMAHYKAAVGVHPSQFH
jgi:hypothetical protein